MTAPTMLVRSLQGDTLSSIAWRHLGQSSGLVEQLLPANPHLADLPPVLPAGIQVRLPILAAAPAAVQAVRLWD